MMSPGKIHVAFSRLIRIHRCNHHSDWLSAVAEKNTDPRWSDEKNNSENVLTF